jgi:ATP-dependent DNA helicase RecG
VSSSTTTLISPEAAVERLRNVGRARARLLALAGFHTIRDLLENIPFRYEDRRQHREIAQLTGSDPPLNLTGSIRSARLKTSPVKRMKVFEAVLDDGTGSILLVWFNQPWLEEKIRKGMVLTVFGVPGLSATGRLQLQNPDWSQNGAGGEADYGGRILPVYSTPAEISQKMMRYLIRESLSALPQMADPIDEALRRELGLMELPLALLELHSPGELADSLTSGARTPAHERLIFGEFLAFQLRLRVRRARLESGTERRRPIAIDERVREGVREVLPFRLTAAQKRVLREITADIAGERPMYRLLQGDVGSGKTIVALIAALVVILSGYQAVFLAPTEILAEQHLQRIRQILASSGLRVEKLTGQLSAAERRRILGELEDGTIDLLIGTHALLEDPVKFRALRLAIVDEQHRFGVEQRRRLFRKGSQPDVLVMTATPIPRSMATAVYGDLDLSVIDELPAGRKEIRTYVRGTARLPRIYGFIDRQIEQGARAYIVYPLIESSDALPAKALVAEMARLRDAFPARRIGVLHGRLSAEEKESAMKRFETGEIDLLVATTIIEVGIDIPEASVMLIMDADRFGLSQLHQLRGRVGRGERQSYCILVRDETCGEDVKKRLRAFAGTSDGFEVARQDLEQRGAGDLLGTRQSGLPALRFGDPLRDADLMEKARETAIKVIGSIGVEEGERLASLLCRERSRSALPRD